MHIQAPRVATPDPKMAGPRAVLGDEGIALIIVRMAVIAKASVGAQPRQIGEANFP